MGTVLSKQYSFERTTKTHSLKMKFQSVAALAVLSTKANANWEKISDLFVQLEEAAYNKTVADDPTQAGDRGFVPQMLALMVDIQYYGCWCYLDTDWDTAKGPVQDGLDQECKNLVQNYRCLVLDALDRGETCDPATADYTTYNLFGGSGNLTLRKVYSTQQQIADTLTKEPVGLKRNAVVFTQPGFHLKLTTETKLAAETKLTALLPTSVVIRFHSITSRLRILTILVLPS